jgi:hypothetical protein
MTGLRIRNAAIAAVGLLLPLILSSAVIISACEQLAEPASSVKTPSPSKAPVHFPGPAEWLVYRDPWFAGVFGVIFYPWCAVYAGTIAAAAALKPASLSRRPALLFVVTLAIGSALATPWLYVAARELIT